MQKTSKPLRQPAGFSMIEILVVITIISILMAATLYTIGNAISSARARATETTILKIDGLLRNRIDAYRTNSQRPTQKTQFAAAMAAVYDFLKSNSIEGVPPGVIELLAKKRQFQQAFPQTLGDNTSLGLAGQYFNGNQQNKAESAEYLYWMITQSDSFGVSPVDSSEFSATEFGDTDGDGRQEFLDAWGEPLRFYRWPTRLLRPAGPGGAINRNMASLLIGGLPADEANLGKDPEDNVNRYSSRVAQDVFPEAEYERLFHTPRTYHVPLIVSGGPDRKVGLLEPFGHDPAVPAYGRLAQADAETLADSSGGPLLDNITNHKKQN